MGSQSKIEWTESTWNPIAGCTKCSPGCDNCYAERMMYRHVCMGAARHEKNPDGDESAWEGYSNVMDEDTHGWNGKIHLFTERLEIPLHWCKERRIFVGSMSDLFHPKVPFEFIKSVLGIIALCPQHTFLLLTKRIERAAELSGAYPDNAHLGVSISTPDELWKLDELRKILAAVRFVSFEPLLADLGKLNLKGIGQVIIGCESGPKRRECKLEWVKSIVDQGKADNVPVFVKQLSISSPYWPAGVNPKERTKEWVSHDMNVWPKDLQIREYPK